MSILQRRLAGHAPTAVACAGELNVTPVLNMFSILIPFLVTMTAFSHLAVQSFQLPGNEGAGHAQTLDQMPLTVALGLEGITLAHADRVLASIPRSASGAAGEAGAADETGFTVLAAEMERARGTLPSVRRVVVAVDDGVRCADVVTCLDRCRGAGFGDVGLAAGANEGSAATRMGRRIEGVRP